MGNDVNDWGCERWERFGYFDHIVRKVSDLCIPFFYDRDYSCSAGLHFHNVADYFLVSIIFRGHEYYWESFFDECDEAVLALACRIRHCWYVAQLEEFQASLQRGGDADSSSEEANTRCATAAFCDLLHVFD